MTGRRPLDAAAVVLALGLLTGCSHDLAPPPAPSPAQTSTPTLSATTATPTATIPPPPLLPAAATIQDQAGAEAFFRYWWEVANWSFVANDSAPLSLISETTCAFCQGLVQDVQDSAARNLTNKDGIVSVSEAVASFGDPAQGLGIVALLDQTASVQTDTEGIVVASGQPHSGLRIDARVVWAGDAWRMASVAKGQDS